MATRLLFHPGSTFAAIDYSSGTGASLIFALIYGSLGQIIGRYWFTLLEIQHGTLVADALTNTLHFALWTVATPVLLLVSLLIGTCTIHCSLAILRGTHRPLRATLQVLAYTSGATALLNVIPLAGSIIAPLWGFVLAYHGLAACHQTSKLRAVLALLLPVIFSVLVLLIIFMGVAATGLLQIMEKVASSL
ncbi:MAG: YIP1 family protein [Deltaproteobacteria bacterium]|nr:YIP1 family protein [Deltaproteobacteria bacterium]MBW2070617.1 YIP1 family protein [Deltaproteobacteria bacterium]